jgi:hypothetical protein
LLSDLRGKKKRKKKHHVSSPILNRSVAPLPTSFGGNFTILIIHSLSMEKFKYHRAIFSLSQIRLVYLLPRQSPRNVGGVEQIRCQMKTVSLNERPEYTALSYTWGDPNPTSVLIMDNRMIQITKSIETALLHLRHEKDTITLWIDQLCS